MISPEINQGGHETLLQQQELFHSQLDFCQELIDAMQATKEVSQEFGNTIIAELDSNCPYMDSGVLISGNALVPDVDDEGNKIGDIWTDVIKEGIHEGVEFVGNEDGRLMIAQRVRINSVSVRIGRTCHGSLPLFAYFDNKANITPLLEIENSFDPYYLSEHIYDESTAMEGFDILHERSAGFVRLLSGTRFRRLGRVRQSQEIDNFIDETSKEAGIADYPVSLCAEYGYITELNLENSVVINQINLDDAVISGLCLAIDSLERVRQPYKKIKKDDELVDKNAGLCLIIDPDRESRDRLPLTESQVIYVPVSGQLYDIELRYS